MVTLDMEPIAGISGMIMTAHQVKQCQAFRLNKKQCTRNAREGSKYCWQHRFSRFGDARWYNNAKVQACIGVVGIVATILFALIGPTRSNQERMLAQTQNLNENVQDIIARLDPGIPEDIKHAIENIFLNILQEKDIPQWQWREKLQETINRHQELLSKWQTVQSGDPEVDRLRANAHRMIELGEYDKADQSLQDAIEADRKAIQLQQQNLHHRELSMARSLASRAIIAETKLEYKKAIDLYKEALAALPNDQQTMQAVFLNNLGALYGIIADYEEAELLIKRALAIDEVAFGQDHPNVAAPLINLAHLYEVKNRLKEAESLYKRAQEIWEESLGKNNPQVAAILNNLAGLYQVTNRLKEAESLFKRAQEIWEESLGKNNPQVAAVLNNLAQLYQVTNRLEEAESLQERALEIWEESLGKNNPQVAAALSNLATLYQDTNRLKEAEPLMKRALAIDEAVFGKEHPMVALRLNNLATLYEATNRLKEAESLLKRALAIDEVAFGKNHPLVAIDLNNLASLCKSTNRFKEAESLMKRALAIDEASLGKDYPDVARDLNNLARLYQATNRLKEAEPLMERAFLILTQSTQRTGYQNPNLQTVIAHYRCLLREMGRSEAEIAITLNRLAPEISKISEIPTQSPPEPPENHPNQQ